MGFSVSGSAAIIFAGMFIAFGMWYSAAFDSFERVNEAQQLEADATLQQQNADINVTSADYSGGTLTVTVENTGATAIPLNETDVIVDNDYATNWRDDASVSGDTATHIWLPEETLTLEVSNGTQPDRVKVVTVGGVADTEVVS